MAADHRDAVERGLRLKKAGNALMTVVGGRSVHPVNVKVGGFHRFPTREELRGLRPQLAAALDDALETVALVAGFEFPDLEQDHEYVSLTGSEYPIEGGTFITSSGTTFAVSEFPDWVTEEQVPHSNALHARLRGHDQYAVGSLARYSLNHHLLPVVARQAADRAGLGPVCRNPFRSIVVRAVEVVVACEEALRIIDGWSGGTVSSVPVPARPGVGHGATEAPRGVLYHRYELAADGTIATAQIVPPTSQNQRSIEHDLLAFVTPRMHLDLAELTRQCEQVIRNYDPCISCATHFLDVTVEEA
jgi:coenzyme F420-reducing hydrogenase alpha subunit